MGFKNEKNWVRHGHLGGYFIKLLKESNMSTPTANVHGNFQFVPDLSDIRHKILRLKSEKNKPVVLGCKWIPKIEKIGARHGHLGGYFIKLQHEINTLPATVNVQGNFPFVPDFSDIWHKKFGDAPMLMVCSCQVMMGTNHLEPSPLLADHSWTAKMLSNH